MTLVSRSGRLAGRLVTALIAVVVVLAACVAVAAIVLAIWWLNSLNGLPDIGDPFDVAAFLAFSIPDEQNAFVFFRRANEKLFRRANEKRSQFDLSPGDVDRAGTVASRPFFARFPPIRIGLRRLF